MTSFSRCAVTASTAGRAPQSAACFLAGQIVSRAVGFPAGTVVGFRDGKMAARAESPDGWREFITEMSCMAQAVAWSRHYGKELRQICTEG